MKHLRMLVLILAAFFSALLISLVGCQKKNTLHSGTHSTPSVTHHFMSAIIPISASSYTIA